MRVLPVAGHDNGVHSTNSKTDVDWSCNEMTVYKYLPHFTNISIPARIDSTPYMDCYGGSIAPLRMLLQPASHSFIQLARKYRHQHTIKRSLLRLAVCLLISHRTCSWAQYMRTHHPIVVCTKCTPAAVSVLLNCYCHSFLSIKFIPRRIRMQFSLCHWPTAWNTINSCIKRF